MCPGLVLQLLVLGVKIYPNTDCCRENINPRSPTQLTTSVNGCVSLCRAELACRAAVFLPPGGPNVAHQCAASKEQALGKGCCLYKAHFDTNHSSRGVTAIDMEDLPPAPPAPSPPTPGPLPAESIRPLYHYTRLAGEMNDPNGLQWRMLSDGSPEYHMFHQHADNCKGSPLPESGTHRWGHARSPDLVRWSRMDDSDVCGSTSGAVTLGSDIARKTGWKAAILSSAPSMSATGNLSVGLHLYTSNDEHLENWTKFTPEELPPNGDPCVICPGLVPDWTNASNIGDTYIWSDPEWSLPTPTGRERTIYVLSGSSVCSGSEDGGHWCGFASGTPQSLLFSSTDLVHWEFENVFWQRHGRGSLYTPDTFALPDGRQALVYLGGGTHWAIGDFDKTKSSTAQNKTPSFVAEVQDVGGELGVGHCGQSLTDAKGRRVQFGWQGLQIEGAGYTGAQSLPRVITVTSAERGGGLLFSPLPELDSLHDLASHITKSGDIPPTTAKFDMVDGVTPTIGLYHHTRSVSPPGSFALAVESHVLQYKSVHGTRRSTLRLTAELNISANSGFSICVQCTADYTGKLMLATVQIHNGQLTCTLGGGMARPLVVTNASRSAGVVQVALELFVDGAIVEFFANGGEQTAYAAQKTVSGSAYGVGIMASGSVPVPLKLDLWRMNQSVF